MSCLHLFLFLLPCGSDRKCTSLPSLQAPAAVEAPACTDRQPPGNYSCQQQVTWGKCSEPWMANVCDQSCEWGAKAWPGKCLPTKFKTGSTRGTGRALLCAAYPATHSNHLTDSNASADRTTSPLAQVAGAQRRRLLLPQPSSVWQHPPPLLWQQAPPPPQLHPRASRLSWRRPLQRQPSPRLCWCQRQRRLWLLHLWSRQLEPPLCLLLNRLPQQLRCRQLKPPLQPRSLRPPALLCRQHRLRLSCSPLLWPQRRRPQHLQQRQLCQQRACPSCSLRPRQHQRQLQRQPGLCPPQQQQHPPPRLPPLRLLRPLRRRPHLCQLQLCLLQLPRALASSPSL